MKVLVIRLSSIGDVILTTPIVRMLYHSLQADIDFVTNDINFPIIEHNPYIRSYFNSDNLPTPQKQHYDLVIDLHNTRKSRRLRFNKSTRIIRTHKSPFRKWLMLLFGINLLNKVHVVENHKKALGCIHLMDDGLGLDIFLKPETRLPEPIKNLKNKIVINTGGSKVTKRIPKTLIHSIITSSPHEFILVGGSDIAGDYDSMTHDNSINLVDQITMQGTLEIIKHGRLLITGDTALMHAAAAFQKEQIVIWGSTSEDFGFYPYYGSNNQDKSIQISQNLHCQPCSKIGKNNCPKGHMSCLTDITAKEVLLCLNKILCGNSPANTLL